MGRYEDAVADFTRAIELDPSEDDYAVRRAEIYWLIRNGKEALPEP
jgi:cytochrome c-type biogenesis protein CcmH/NrfG